MTAVFLDTDVLVYAVGGPHPAREECVALLRLVASGDLAVHASVELVQEFLFHRMRRTTRAQAVEEARHVGDLCTLHAFDEKVLARAVDLVASGGVGGRDAVHVATALLAGFTQIVSLDTGLDSVAGIQRVVPRSLVRDPAPDDIPRPPA